MTLLLFSNWFIMAVYKYTEEYTMRKFINITSIIAIFILLASTIAKVAGLLKLEQARTMALDEAYKALKLMDLPISEALNAMDKVKGLYDPLIATQQFVITLFAVLVVVSLITAILSRSKNQNS